MSDASRRPHGGIVTTPTAALRPTSVRAQPLSVLLTGLSARLSGPAAGSVDPQVSGVSLDSRLVQPGDLYVALPGSASHGAVFVRQAEQAGAVAVLTDDTGAASLTDSPVPVVVVQNPRVAMAQLAAQVYGWPAAGLLTLAVTGTNGKTTTVFLLEAALSAVGRTPGTIGTMGFRLRGETLDGARTTVTTPESPDLQALLAVLAERGADSVAMEVSSHALALDRVEGLHVAVAGFTNLGRDHLDFHPSMEAYFEAKAKLFTPARTEVAVVNVDDPWGRLLADRVRADGRVRLVTTALDRDADFQATGWTSVAGGSRVHLRTPGAALQFEVGLPGEYNVRNAVTALAMLDAAGIDITRAAHGLAAAVVPGRMQPVILTPATGAPRVVVDFAHTPQAVKAALGALPSGRVVVVLGCGGDRDRDKRAPMGAAAVANADVVIVTDDNPRFEDPAAIRAAVLAGAHEARASAQPGSRAASVAIVDGGPRRAAIRSALQAAGPHGVVAVLGKGHEQGQDVAGAIRPFDDVAVVQQEWAALIEQRASHSSADGSTAP